MTELYFLCVHLLITVKNNLKKHLFNFPQILSKFGICCSPCEFHFNFVFSCRPFTVPLVLRQGNKPEDDEDGVDEEEEETLSVLRRVDQPSSLGIIYIFFFLYFRIICFQTSPKS